MKRITSFILSLILCFSLLAVPCVDAAATGDAVPPTISKLNITTANKQRLLKLTWEQQPEADGYQIYRSTTGKKGSFDKIATIKNQSSYVHKGLKNSTTYYYKVRAFEKKNGEIFYGGFAKANLSTRLTNSYVEKYIKKANEVYNDWLYAKNGGGVNYNKKITIRHNSMEMDYYLIKNKKIKSIADIEKIVGQYFDPSLIYDEYTYYQPYYEYKGRVYALAEGVGTTFWAFDSMKIKSASDKKTIVTINYIDFFGDSDNPGEPAPFKKNVKLIYVEDHWRIQGEFYNEA